MTIERRATGATMASEAIAADPSHSHYRWFVCALLFFAATVNYADRNVIGLLKPTLQAQFHWTEIDYSNIIFWFQLAYAIGLLTVGRLIDYLGTRVGFALTVFVWSLASMSHALARSVFGFSLARFALGLGESGSFPASIKTVAEWFPKKERALATGLFNSGTNVGAILVPLIIPPLIFKFGWQGAFIGMGLLDFVWLALWLTNYRRPEDHPKVSAAELAYIRSDSEQKVAQVRWASLVRYRQTWAFAIGKFLTDPIWWVYLFWVPDFLHRRHGVDLKGMFLPLVVIYTAATIGSISGGWLSGSLIRRGWSVNAGRKTAMLICALAVVPIMLASRVGSLWSAVWLIGLAAAAHQGWSANIFTISSDMFPRQAVGSIVGIGGMAGAVGGMLIAKTVGYVLQFTGSYLPVFVIAGSAYLVALLVIQILAPRLQPVELRST